MVVNYLTISVRLMFGRIAKREMGRSGCSLSWLAVYCQLLISQTAPTNALFNIHLGKFEDSHISIWLSAAHAPTPCSTAHLVHCAAGGLLGHTQSSASHSPSLQAPGLGGANQSLLGSLLLSCAHLKSASQQGYVVPSCRLPLATPYSPIRGTGPP